MFGQEMNTFNKIYSSRLVDTHPNLVRQGSGITLDLQGVMHKQEKVSGFT